MKNITVSAFIYVSNFFLAQANATLFYWPILKLHFIFINFYFLQVRYVHSEIMEAGLAVSQSSSINYENALLSLKLNKSALAS